MKVRGLLAEFEEIISFQNCVDEIKKYAAENGADELTKIFAVQMFVAESDLKIIYHGSEGELKNKFGLNFFTRIILTANF